MSWPSSRTLHYPSLWRWLHAGASSTNSPNKINSLPFSFNQLSPINLLDTKNFPSKYKKKPPCQENKENVWIQPFSPCSRFPAWSIPGMNVHHEHSSGQIRIKGIMMWWCSCGPAFSQVRHRGPRAEERSPVPRHGHNQGVQGSMWELPWTSASVEHPGRGNLSCCGLFLASAVDMGYPWSRD